MQVLISSRNFDITPAIQEKIENAVASSITDKNLKISSVRVVTEKEKLNFKVTLSVNTKGHDFVSIVPLIKPLPKSRFKWQKPLIKSKTSTTIMSVSPMSLMIDTLI